MALIYRKDIDGLRGVSIVLVILFHAFEKILPSGFVGVDIFFVISGFVISGVIDQEYGENRFSLKRFYEKRVRRIYPALITVMLAVSVFGWQSLFADELKQLGTHIVGSAFFISNFILYSETGYFDNAAETKPLLHLWSLAVEEQFYILWPIILVYVLKHWRSRIIVITSLYIGFSYVLQILYYQLNPEAAFYLPFNRAWELAVGALAYFGLIGKRYSWFSGWIQTSLSLLLLMIALLVINKNNFPGWIAVLPVLAAFGLITAAPNQLKTCIFENRIMVFIGSISYPLYLWHWPVISYIHIVKGENIDQGLLIIGVISAFILAVLTYQFIEKPVRFGRFKSKNVALPLLSVMMVMAAIGYSAVVQQGYKNRTVAVGNMGFIFVNTKDMGYLNCDDYNLVNDISKIDYCYIGKSGVVDAVIIGDSHAEDKFWGLVEKDAEHNWMLIGSTQCPFLADELSDNICQHKTRYMMQWLVEQANIKTVVISFFMNKWLGVSYPKTLDATLGDLPVAMLNKTQAEQMEAGLDKTIAALFKHGKNVSVLIDMPQLPYNPKSCARMQINCQLVIERVKQDQRVIREMLDRLKKHHPQLTLFDPKQLICDDRDCFYQLNGIKIYRDQDHLTPQGSSLYAEQFMKELYR